MATTEAEKGSQTTPWKALGQAEALEGKIQVELIRLEGSVLMPFLNSRSDRISSSEAAAPYRRRVKEREKMRTRSAATAIEGIAE